MDGEGGPGLRDVLQRHVGVAGLDVVYDRVTLGERPPLGVLAGEPDGHPVLQKGGEGKRLSVGPVNTGAIAV